MRVRLGLGFAICALAVSPAGVAGSATRLPGFHSPSGNTRCLFIPGRPSTLLCKVAHADYAKKLKAYCGAPPIGVDWSGFTLGPTRKGSVGCSGGILYDPDTQRPAYVNLPYGKSWRHGVFTCSSRVTGVTCRNRTGHGLFISRQSWRVW